MDFAKRNAEALEIMARQLVERNMEIARLEAKLEEALREIERLEDKIDIYSYERD